jgi:hypothetical protein
MTTVVIRPESGNGKRFRAVAGKNESFGSTMGEALDALTEDLNEAEDRAVVLIQDFRPDEFFNEDQQRRLSFLMTKWRSARDLGEDFPTEEQIELEELIQIELEAAGKRSERLAEQIG